MTDLSNKRKLDLHVNAVTVPEKKVKSHEELCKEYEEKKKRRADETNEEWGDRTHGLFHFMFNAEWYDCGDCTRLRSARQQREKEERKRAGIEKRRATMARKKADREAGSNSKVTL